MAKPASERLDPTTGQIEWDIFDSGDAVDDAIDLPFLWLNFLDGAPTSAGLVYLYIVSPEGPNFKGLIRTVDLVGVTESIAYYNVPQIEPEHKFRLEYANPDGKNICGEAHVRRRKYKK